MQLVSYLVSYADTPEDPSNNVRSNHKYKPNPFPFHVVVAFGASTCGRGNNTVWRCVKIYTE